LRYKESNRLEDYAVSLRDVGVAIDVREDGLCVHPSSDTVKEALFHSHGDHRLVMAAVLLTLAGNTALTVDAPWSVTKSYPAFWNDVRAAGWLLERTQEPAAT